MSDSLCFIEGKNNDKFYELFCHIYNLGKDPSLLCYFEFLQKPTTEQDVKVYLDNTPGRYFVVIEDGKPVGIAGFIKWIPVRCGVHFFLSILPDELKTEPDLFQKAFKMFLLWFTLNIPGYEFLFIERLEDDKLNEQIHLDCEVMGTAVLYARGRINRTKIYAIPKVQMTE